MKPHLATGSTTPGAARVGDDATSEMPARGGPRAINSPLRLRGAFTCRVGTCSKLSAFLAVHAAASALIFLGAFEARFEGSVPPQAWQLAMAALPWLVGARLVALLALGCSRYRWLDGCFAYSTALAVAVAAGSLFLGLMGSLGVGIPALPRSILLIDWACATILFCGARAGIRLIREGPLRRAGDDRTCSALVLGAGDAAEALVREVRRRPEMGISVVGLVDADPLNRGLIRAGVRVLGTPDDLAAHRVEDGGGLSPDPRPLRPRLGRHGP